MRKTLCLTRKSGGNKTLLTLEFEALHRILNRDRLHIHFSPLLRMLEWIVCTYVVSELHWILSWETYGMPKRNMCGRYPCSLATHKMGWRLCTTCRIVLVNVKQSPSYSASVEIKGSTIIGYRREQNQVLLGSGRISQGVALSYSTDIQLWIILKICLLVYC